MPVRSASQSMVTVKCGGSPGGAGAVLGGAGQSADLQQGIGVALRGAAGVGNGVGGGSRCGELVDQGPKRSAVLGFEIALQAEAAVAAVPQPQLPGGGGGLGLVAGFGSVRVEGLRMCRPIRCSDVELTTGHGEPAQPLRTRGPGR